MWHLTVHLACSQTPLEHQDNLKMTENNSDSQNQQLTTNQLTDYKNALYALKQNQLTKAKNILLNLIEEHPNLAGPHANLGIIYYKLDNIKLASTHLTKAIKLNPSNPYAHNTLALISKTEGNFTQAEKHLLIAINNKDDYAKAHFNLALLYDIYFHKIKESIHHYRKYLVILADKDLDDKKTRNWLEQLENSLKKG